MTIMFLQIKNVQDDFNLDSDNILYNNTIFLYQFFWTKLHLSPLYPRAISWDDNIVSAVSYRLESQLKDIQSQWESYLSNTSKATVSKDVELQRLKEDEERIKIDLMQRKEDIDRWE